MTGLLIKRGNVDTGTHVGRVPWEDEGKYWNEAFYKPRNAEDCQETTRHQESGVQQMFPATLKRDQPQPTPGSQTRSSQRLPMSRV